MALILALTLALGVLLITSVSIVNVITHQLPTQALGENTTQVLTSVLGGVVGVLGGYVGFKTRHRSADDGHDDAEPEPDDQHRQPDSGPYDQYP